MTTPDREQKATCDICEKPMIGMGKQITWILSRERPRVTVTGSYCSPDCAKEAALAIHLGMSL